MDRYVLIERGASGLPRIHGPFDARDEAERAKGAWAWSRWTTSIEVGVLGNPEHAAYAGMGGRGWDAQ